VNATGKTTVDYNNATEVVGKFYLTHLYLVHFSAFGSC
jgi:hypothetical protein